jgi:very-short-patch-repair endonuclease
MFPPSKPSPEPIHAIAEREAGNLVVETDGYRHHRTRAAFERDRARDTVLAAAGYRTLRFSYRQLTEDPRAVVAALRPPRRPRPPTSSSR